VGKTVSLKAALERGKKSNQTPGITRSREARKIYGKKGKIVLGGKGVLVKKHGKLAAHRSDRSPRDG